MNIRIQRENNWGVVRWCRSAWNSTQRRWNNVQWKGGDWYSKEPLVDLKRTFHL